MQFTCMHFSILPKSKKLYLCWTYFSLVGAYNLMILGIACAPVPTDLHVTFTVHTIASNG